jgi:hypothetical protein
MVEKPERIIEIFGREIIPKFSGAAKEARH